MPRKTAMLLSGIITAFALMVVVGLVYGANRDSTAAAANAQPAAAAVSQTAPTLTSNDGSANSAAVAQLQAEVQTYKQQLQQAYSDLQQAYDQIQTMNNALSQSQGGGRRFRGQDGEGEGRQFQGQNSQGLQGFLGGSDD